MKRINDETAEVVFKQLMSRDPHGLLRAEAVVEVARDPRNPFHSQFEWSDTEAARLFRLEQARDLIQSFRVKIPELNISVRALSSLDLDRRNGGGFRWTLEALERPDLRTDVLNTALRELNATRLRYEHLEELAEVWDTIKEAQAGKASVRSR